MAVSGPRPFPSGRGRATGEPPSDREPGPDADPVAVARQICLHQLEHSPRTRAELAAVLSRRGVADDVAEQVLGRFEEAGLIDDTLFSELWVNSRHRSRGLAGRAISQELRRKGVDDEVVREAVAAIDPEEELATARALVDRKLPSTRGLAADARVRRLAGMLARKGYGAAVAYRVVKEALAAEGVDLVLDTDGLSALD
ncbi:MAG: regulatory protein RecX [Mycobacteriales bacterium]|nr:regulatory protein RecX [Mycobacteriales bacterium]